MARGARVRVFSVGLLAFSFAFIGPVARPVRNRIALRADAEAPVVAEASDAMEPPKQDWETLREGWEMRVSKNTDPFAAVRAVKDRLNTHGKVVMSCMGRDAVHLTMRILRKTVDFYKNVTDPEGASVAFSPQVRRGEDGLVSMDFHVRRVAFAPDEGDLLLKATKDVNQLSKLAGQMVRRVRDKGGCRVATLGKEKMFLTIKALERANAFAAREDGETIFRMWAVPHLKTLGGMNLTSTVLTVVQGPQLEEA
ncbi:unnamed protein product [Effrenium voratum]|nr:unnamed protein product [Effrenium voratum]|mmetsp:Transcript_26801/g.63830  ORF Transcript_26801/g.63830 Transcript_26801/m.63830 type:complete len:253 (+) Transcript_26801:57-815(+)